MAEFLDTGPDKPELEWASAAVPDARNVEEPRAGALD